MPPMNWQQQELADIEDAIARIERTLADLKKRRDELKEQQE